MAPSVVWDYILLAFFSEFLRISQLQSRFCELKQNWPFPNPSQQNVQSQLANHTNNKLIRSSSLQSRLNLDPVNAFEDMSDSELDNYLGKLHDYAVELKVSNQANQERASSHYCEVPPSHLFQKESRALAAQRFSNKKWGRGRPPPGRQQIERRNNRYRSKTTQPVRR